MSGEPSAKKLKPTIEDEDSFDDIIFEPEGSSSDEEFLPATHLAAKPTTTDSDHQGHSDVFQRLEAKIDRRMFHRSTSSNCLKMLIPKSLSSGFAALMREIRSLQKEVCMLKTRTNKVVTQTEDPLPVTKPKLGRPRKTKSEPVPVSRPKPIEVVSEPVPVPIKLKPKPKREGSPPIEAATENDYFYYFPLTLEDVLKLDESLPADKILREKMVNNLKKKTILEY